jgi:alkylation response protein AidB-like acyl-CoA dehydrogenase
VAVTGVSGLLGAYLDPASAEEIYGGQSIVGGVFAPRGRAVADAAGLTVSGRWSFASGCAHADWLMVGCVVADGEDVLRTPGGSPEIRMVFFPRETYTVHDTWDVAGLRATGSHDIALEARTAVQAHSVSVLTQSPRIEAPLYAFPLFGLFAQSIAAVLLGIAEGALADLVELAVAKTPTGYARPLAARNDTQARVARAQAALDAVRSLVAETVGEAWSMAQAGDEVTLAARAALRRCATHAAETAVRVTGDMYALGGGTSVYRASPLQRRMRDIQAQHALVGPATLELAGRVSMGLQADVSQL